MARVEGQLAVRVEKDVGIVRVRYEQQCERLKRELLEVQGGVAEREARQRVVQAEEKGELDRLRYLSQRLQVWVGGWVGGCIFVRIVLDLFG